MNLVFTFSGLAQVSFFIIPDVVLKAPWRGTFSGLAQDWFLSLSSRSNSRYHDQQQDQHLL